jgi:hypothetical protein
MSKLLKKKTNKNAHKSITNKVTAFGSENLRLYH